MGLYNKAILALDVAKDFLARLPASAQQDALTRITAFQSSLRVEASKANERGRKEGKIHQAELDRRARYKTLVKTNHFAKAFSPDILMCICEYGMEVNPNFGVVMRGVCREWRDALGMFPAVFGRLFLTGKRPAAIPPHLRTRPGEKAEEKEQMWKRLSGGKIRSLRISARDNGELDRIAQNMVDCVNSLKRLEIVDKAETVLTSWAGRLQQLEELKLQDSAGTNWQPDSSVDFSFGLMQPNSTSLRCVEIKGLNMLLDQRIIHPSPTAHPDHREREDDPDIDNSFPTKHVQRLSIDSTRMQCNTTSPLDCLFQPIPDLEELVIHRSAFYLLRATGEDAEKADERRQLVRLNHLVRYIQSGPVDSISIHVGILSDEPIFVLDHLIYTPNLTDLSLYQIRFPILEGLATGGFELGRLESLDIGKNIVDDHDEFIDLARQMASLKFLNVSHTSLGDKFLQAIQHRDGLDESDQVLPNLVAISLAHTDVSTLVVRDFVNSRLPPHRRMKTARRVEPVKPKIGGAFRPSQKPKPSSTSTPSKISSGESASRGDSLLTDLDETVFSTQPSKLSPDRSIRWICLDGCETIAPDLIPLLKKHVKYVSWWLGTPVEDRHRGMGRWDWRDDYASCADTNAPCYMRPIGNSESSNHFIYVRPGGAKSGYDS